MTNTITQEVGVTRSESIFDMLNNLRNNVCSRSITAELITRNLRFVPPLGHAPLLGSQTQNTCQAANSLKAIFGSLDREALGMLAYSSSYTIAFSLYKSQFADKPNGPMFFVYLSILLSIKYLNLAFRIESSISGILTKKGLKVSGPEPKIKHLTPLIRALNLY
jgi:hypothetical protein